MKIKLTMDQYIILSSLYKMYLESIQSGKTSIQSKRFDIYFNQRSPILMNWPYAEIDKNIVSLKNAKLINVYFDGAFDLTDYAIAFMETRPTNGLELISEFDSVLNH